MVLDKNRLTNLREGEKEMQAKTGRVALCLQGNSYNTWQRKTSKNNFKRGNSSALLPEAKIIYILNRTI